MSTSDTTGSIGAGPAEQVLAASIARRFHCQGRTKTQIAEEFGISRFKVARLLQAAVTHGWVRLEIAVPAPLDLRLSDAVRSAYGLRRALVLRRAGEEQDSSRVPRGRTAALAADLLAEVVRPGEVLGLAWGRTVNTVIDALTYLPPCTVVQLCGVYSRMGVWDDSVETVRRAAVLCGGAFYPLYAPLILPDPSTGEIMRRQPGIREAFDRFGQVTTAVVGIGAWQPGESTVYDVLDPAGRQAVGDLGIRADLAGTLFDADGHSLTTGLTHHVLAIEARLLRTVPEVIAVAAGRTKAGAIDAVLRSGLVTTLVTDAGAAERLLPLARHRPPARPATDRAAPAGP